MTGEIPKWQKDLGEVVNMGNDIGVYMSFRAYLAQIAEREDVHGTDLFNALNLVANALRAL